jgi:hypothetical protein
VPKLSVHLTRYDGVLTPNHRWHRFVTPAKSSKSAKRIDRIEDQGVIDRILAHLHEKEQDLPVHSLLMQPHSAPPEILPLFARKESSSTAYDRQGRYKGPGVLSNRSIVRVTAEIHQRAILGARHNSRF